MTHKAFVVSPHIKEKELLRSADSRLDEAVGLAKAIDLDVVEKVSVPLREVKPSTYIGEGVIDRIKTSLSEKEVDVLIMDCMLSPVQQRNLEKAWNVKVIDRTALILEIFGQRAQTKEGGLQVELAHLIYQRSRLVRSWTHLERQRGGMGFLGGPGETQIEIDRRLIDERIVKIKKELEQVQKRRNLQRQARKRVPFPVVALVGYTNAGKSTLFNRLTNANVFAKELLFATLDPTMRQVKLPSSRHIILSDTVGFISDLPHELIAAFRATLEEVLEADIILHVRDCAHEDTLAQKKDVEDVLKDLGAKAPVLEVMNKLDLLDADDKCALVNRAKGKYFPISALTGEGISQLLAMIDAHFAAQEKLHYVRVPFTSGKSLAMLYEKGCVEKVAEEEDNFIIAVRLTPKAFGYLLENEPDLVFLKE